MIKNYICNKTNKKLWAITGEYIGRNPLTLKEKRINKKGFKTKKEAELYIAEAKLNFNSSTSILSDNITLARLWDLWYETKIYKVTDASKLVINNQKEKYIIPYFGHLQVKKIHAALIQEYFNNTLAPLYSTATMQLTKTYLKSILEYAVDLDLIKKNPAKNIRVPKKVVKESIFLEKKQLTEFLNTAKTTLSKINYIYIRLLAMTGARKGEIGALTWSDINFKDCTISIDKTITNTEKGKRVFGATTKNITSKRVITIDKETINLLLELRRSQIISMRIFEISHYNNLGKRVKRCAEKIGVIGLSAHDLRRTHATLLLEAGVNIKAVQERLGHSDIKTTLSIYTKVTKSQRNDVVDTFLEHIS